MGKYFWFYGAVVPVSAVVFLSSLFERKVYRFSLQDVFAVLFWMFGLSVTWFHDPDLSNKWITLLLLLPVYFCFRYASQDNGNGRDFMLLFLADNRCGGCAVIRLLSFISRFV
ncbi:MAG: hypothetical protein LBV74_13805 [Tannerella sp.]|jgi:hypothetical protein|nr:hypothetical protein [Tannerella sp.]